MLFMTEDFKAQVRNAREEQQMSNENEAQNEAEQTSETLVLVSRRFASLAPTWSQHGADLDTVLRAITDRARDGKADSNGYEIIEVTVRRRFHIQPVITAAEVTEVTA